MQVVLSTLQVNSSRVEYTLGLQKHTLDLCKQCSATSQVYTNHAEHISDLYKPYISLTKHIPGLNKPCWAHSNSIQTVLNTHQVYRSTLHVYANRARAHPISMQLVTSTTPGLYNPCSITPQVFTYNISTPQVKQAVSDTPRIYTNHAKHTWGLYKPYRTPLRSIQSCAHTPDLYKPCQAYHESIEAALGIPKFYVYK
jgi:hypothetical protein